MALLQEAPSIGKDEARRLLAIGTVEPPYLESAENLDAVDLPYIPPARNHTPTYAVIAIRESVAIPQANTQAKISVSPKGIIITQGIDLDFIAKTGMNVQRQTLRLHQYETLTAKIADWDYRRSNGEELPIAADALDVWKKVANSWAQNELSKDPLTETVKKDRDNVLLPNTKNVLLAADAIVRTDGIHAQDIEDEVERILFPKKGKEIEANTKALQDETFEKKKKRQQEEGQRDAKEEEEYKKMVGDLMKYGKEEAYLSEFPYDEFLDEPSVGASVFVEILYQRPSGTREKEPKMPSTDAPSSDADTKYIPIEEIWNRNF